MAHTLDQSQTNHDLWLTTTIYGVRWRGQSFTTGVGVTNISKVALWLRRGGDDLTATVNVHAVDGDGKPTGASMGSKDITGVPTGAGEVEFEFATAIDCLAETKYCFVLSYPNGDASNALSLWSAPADSAYAGGEHQISQDGGDTWGVYTAYDSYFKTYYEEAAAEAFTESCTEATTLVDSIALKSEFSKAKTDAVGLNESVQRPTGFHITVEDGAQ